MDHLGGAANARGSVGHHHRSRVQIAVDQALLVVTNLSRNERMPATTCASAVPRGDDDDNNNNGAAGTFASARSAAACGASSSEHLPN